jgi:quaternary ammonium compound-resistance protein SugE
MAWLYLVVAGPVRDRLAARPQEGLDRRGLQVPWILFAIVCMTVSGALLMTAQRAIPMGTAYAVWTGIGAVGAFVTGIPLFGDSAPALRITSIALIIAGIVGLKTV